MLSYIINRMLVRELEKQAVEGGSDLKEPILKVKFGESIQRSDRIEVAAIAKDTANLTENIRARGTEIL